MLIKIAHQLQPKKGLRFMIIKDLLLNLNFAMTILTLLHRLPQAFPSNRKGTLPISLVTPAGSSCSLLAIVDYNGV